MDNLNKKVTGILIIHNDSSMLEMALDSAKEFIDDLVVVDGAYKWVAPFCELLGENSYKSSDNLIGILDDSKIPYQYFSGIWDSETHKREFSLQQAKNDFLMLIDSDELFDLDVKEVNNFIESGKAIGDCFFPLYFSPECVGFSTGLKTPPVKAIFLNKRDYGIKSLVNSLFLLVPDGERTKKIANNLKYKIKLGYVHHLSLFRSDGSGFRRSRFYNLLAMRVNKKLNSVSSEEFENDEEFFRIINDFDREQMEALNNLFEFHRITAAFPNVKSNQYFDKLRPASNSKFHSVMNKYEGMISEQSKLFALRSNIVFNVLSSKPIFIDVSNQPACLLTIFSNKSSEISVVLHYESSKERSFVNLDSILINESEWKLSIVDNKDATRKVLEIVPRSKFKIVDFKYCLV